MRPGNGVVDGYGPPSMAYMRAVAANHYLSGADGMSLFNFSCADGAFSRDALVDLAEPPALESRDKQYVLALWPWDAQIYYSPWASRFRLAPGQAQAEYPLRMADNFDDFRSRGRPFSAILTLEWKGLNRIGDIETRFNGQVIHWNGFHYNHYDDGCWNDIVQYTIPADALQNGVNTIELRRLAEIPGFVGACEVQKCVLDVHFGDTVHLGSLV